MQVDDSDSIALGENAATKIVENIPSSALPVDPFRAVEQGMGDAYNVVSILETVGMALDAFEELYGFDPALKPRLWAIKNVLLVAEVTLKDALEMIDGGEIVSLSTRAA